MPPALGPTLTTVPGPALGAHPPQGPCCFHWLCSPYAPCSEGAGPTSPQWTASSPPFVAHHRAAHTQGRGPGNFQQEQKFAICLACIWNPPWARFLALPLFPSYCPLASRFLSWAGKTQTAQIPKAPYFSTKYILQTLQPPWNIPDLTFSPPSLPFPLEHWAP
jgi:hypothetical protein